VKNAIDYVEDLGMESPAYLEGRAVGIIVTSIGWQGGMATLSGLRSIVHALRGWPTPLGVLINTSKAPFDPNGNCVSAKLEDQLKLLASEIMVFVQSRQNIVEQKRSSVVL
jgi:FMN reductase